ncbi:hypothetical protein DXG01_016959 [Tephrocybe rancida]|nr:hypothetical protein DXG01_016959 [Tephrocybe rancida]
MESDDRDQMAIDEDVAPVGGTNVSARARGKQRARTPEIVSPLGKSAKLSGQLPPRVPPRYYDTKSYCLMEITSLRLAPL